MKQIEPMNFVRLYQDESFSFLKQTQSALPYLPQNSGGQEYPDVQSLLRTLSLKSERLQKAVDKFNTAFEAFDAALKMARKNPVTEKINAADADRDDAWTYSSAYINVMLHHPDKEVAAVAKIARDLFDKYGNPTRFSQAKESGVFHNLLQDIEAMESRETIDFDPWYNWMKSAEEAFETADLERSTAKGNVQKGVAKEKRQEAEEAYREMAMVINSIVVVEETDEYDKFINTVNAKIEQMSAISKGRTTRRENSKDKEDDDRPATDDPSDEEPDTPSTDHPATEDPDTENPSTGNPSVEEPDTDTPGGSETPEEPDDRPVVQ